MPNAAPDQFPTMIIPRGTEIRINNHGQLSIRTPGNLVIQNSGEYAEIESTNGSIRIEDNVGVEAISIKAGESCFIQGTLTAWRVAAKKISLEDSAKAHIMPAAEPGLSSWNCSTPSRRCGFRPRPCAR